MVIYCQRINHWRNTWYILVIHNDTYIWTGCNGYPLVNIQKAIEHGHRNSECSHEKWVDLYIVFCKRLPGRVIMLILTMMEASWVITSFFRLRISVERHANDSNHVQSTPVQFIDIIDIIDRMNHHQEKHYVHIFP